MVQRESRLAGARWSPRQWSRSAWVGVIAWAGGSLLALGYVSQGTFSLLFEKPYIHYTTFFYREQLLAMLSGRLSVTTGLLGECHIRDGQCYGYYGLTPSLLRAPLLLVGFPGSGSPLLGWLAVSLSIAVSVWLVATLRGPSRSLIWFAVGAATVALASPVLIDMTRSVATEAITWGVAFTLLALAGFLAWRRDGREAWLVLVAVALALGANARPGVAVAGPVLALAVLASGGSGGRGSRPHGEGGHGFGLWRRPWTLWLTAAAIAVVPLFGLLSVFWLKFRQFIPDWTMHEAYPEKEMYATAMAASGGQLAGLPFLPTVTAFYLRPFGVGMTEEFPWLVWRGEVTTIPPLAAGSVVNEGGLSLTATYPLVIILGVLLGVCVIARGIGIYRRGSLRRVLKWVTGARLTPLALLVLASAAPASTSLMYHSVAPRFLADFTAFIVVVTGLGCGYVGQLRLSRSAFAAAAGLAVTMTVWSVLVVNAFAIRLSAPLLVPAPVAERSPSLTAAGILCPSPRSLTAERLTRVTPACQLTLAAFAQPAADAVLVASTDSRVRAAVAEFTAEPDLLARLATDGDTQVRAAVARREQATGDILAALATDSDARVRLAVAHNPSAPPRALTQLVKDPDPEVAAAAWNPRPAGRRN